VPRVESYIGLASSDFRVLVKNSDGDFLVVFGDAFVICLCSKEIAATGMTALIKPGDSPTGRVRRRIDGLAGILLHLADRVGKYVERKRRTDGHGK